jgi:hypothetical protein
MIELKTQLESEMKITRYGPWLSGASVASRRWRKGFWKKLKGKKWLT